MLWWVILAAIVVAIIAGLSLTRVRGRAPGWSRRYFREREYRRFAELVTQFFEQRGTPILIEEDGSAKFTQPRDENEQSEVIFLNNLAQICAKSERAAWPEVIGEFLTNMTSMKDRMKEFEEEQQNYENVKGLLKLRLQGEDYIDQIRTVARGDEPLPIVYRDYLPGVIGVLVFDLPQSVMSLHWKTFDAWKRQPDEVYATALENVRAQDEVELQHRESDGLRMYFLSGESHFVATHALLLDKYPECFGPEGALVGIPSRNYVNILPLVASPLIDREIARIGFITHQIFNDTPGSISKDLYWRRDGQWEKIHFSAEGPKINIGGSPEFHAMVRRLKGEAETD